MVIKIDERSDEHTFGYSSEVGSGSNRKQVKFYLIYGKLQNIFCFIEYDFCHNFLDKLVYVSHSIVFLW